MSARTCRRPGRSSTPSIPRPTRSTSIASRRSMAAIASCSPTRRRSPRTAALDGPTSLIWWRGWSTKPRARCASTASRFGGATSFPRTPSPTRHRLARRTTAAIRRATWTTRSSTPTGRALRAGAKNRSAAACCAASAAPCSSSPPAAQPAVPSRRRSSSASRATRRSTCSPVRRDRDTRRCSPSSSRTSSASRPSR